MFGIAKYAIRLVNGIMKNFSKIIVTGPPRSGTTITARILAYNLKYKFIDETHYDGNDQNKFAFFLYHPRKMVIQMTAWTRDVHNLFFNQPTLIVLVKRNIQDILESMKYTEKFLETNVGVDKGMFRGFNQDAINYILQHFGVENNQCLPEVIYKHFEENKNPYKNYQTVNYDDFKNHKLFIKKKIRREKFIHIKQFDIDPGFLDKKGVVVL